MKILLLDNYDSFTFNLAHLLEELCCDFEVIRNNKLSLTEIYRFDRILLSPGPGIPCEAGLMPEIVRTFAALKPMLGVCLGHQCIGECFGATLVNMPVPVHGKSSTIQLTVNDETLFAGLGPTLEVGRYHSWLVSSENLPDVLEITSVDEYGAIMSLRHKDFNVKGVQFHPESVMTGQGKKLIENWLQK